MNNLTWNKFKITSFHSFNNFILTYIFILIAFLKFVIHLFIFMLIYSFSCSFIHFHVHLFIFMFIYPFFVLLCISCSYNLFISCSFIHSLLIYSFFYAFHVHLFIFLYIYSFSCSFNLQCFILYLFVYSLFICLLFVYYFMLICWFYVNLIHHLIQLLIEFSIYF